MKRRDAGGARAPWRSGRRKVGLCLLVSTVTAGCADLLEVELPGEIQEAALTNPSNAQALVASAVGAFECAFTNFVLLSGNLGDELMALDSFERFFPYDQRLDIGGGRSGYSTASCDTDGGLYAPMHMARWLADEAVKRVEQFPVEKVANRTQLLATALAYSGYTYTLFGEAWCEAAFDGGPALAPQDVLKIAEDRFTRALELAQQAGDQKILNLARVGRARARLHRGDKSGAAADARLVAPGFEFFASRSNSHVSRENKVYVVNHLERRTGPEPGFWNLTWKGVPDPRVKVIDTGRKGNDALTPLWLQTKYTARESPLRVASYDEARLIIAEAEMGRTAVDIINELHREAGLPPYDPATDGDLLQQIILERSRELWLEGHRLGDLLRFNLPFPSGVQPWTGRPYGSTTCFPLPRVEIDNNPNIRRS